MCPRAEPQATLGAAHTPTRPREHWAHLWGPTQPQALPTLVQVMVGAGIPEVTQGREAGTPSLVTWWVAVGWILGGTCTNKPIPSVRVPREGHLPPATLPPPPGTVTKCSGHRDLTPLKGVGGCLSTAPWERPLHCCPGQELQAHWVASKAWRRGRPGG